jgi:hypothetical protein
MLSENEGLEGLEVRGAECHSTGDSCYVRSLDSGGYHAY